MSSLATTVRRAAVVGAVLLAGAASAALQSSCPAPCTKPPKSIVFARETDGILDNFGHMTPIGGTLAKGIAKAVVRVEASANVFLIGKNFGELSLGASVNGVTDSDPNGEIAFFRTSCAPDGFLCSVTGTFWFDLDALEAAYPGTFLGQPLVISVGGGSPYDTGQGWPYGITFSAALEKK